MAFRPLLVAILTFGALAAGLVRARREQRKPLADRLDAELPQTQCARCGYAGCRPYAEAIAAGAADINQCPPGGTRVMRRLARLANRMPKAIDPARGVQEPRQVALIDERACIGCTLCIQACPVDAIAGANGLMHTVIAAECTGCALCLAPCPVDCIVLEPAPWTAIDRLTGEHRRAKHRASARFHARRDRLERLRREQLERMAARAAARRSETDAAAERKRAIVEAAIRRARTRLAAGK